jgi:hypothetical protein
MSWSDRFRRVVDPDDVFVECVEFVGLSCVVVVFFGVVCVMSCPFILLDAVVLDVVICSCVACGVVL